MVAALVHYNVGFCIAAKEILKIHIFTVGETADLIKKSLIAYCSVVF
jgi:hypothetical protein